MNLLYKLSTSAVSLSWHSLDKSFAKGFEFLRSITTVVVVKGRNRSCIVEQNFGSPANSLPLTPSRQNAKHFEEEMVGGNIVVAVCDLQECQDILAWK